MDYGASCSGGCTFHKQCLVSEDKHEPNQLFPNIPLSEAVKLAMGDKAVADAGLAKFQPVLDANTGRLQNMGFLKEPVN